MWPYHLCNKSLESLSLVESNIKFNNSYYCPTFRLPHGYKKEFGFKVYIPLLNCILIVSHEPLANKTIIKLKVVKLNFTTTRSAYC